MNGWKCGGRWEEWQTCGLPVGHDGPHKATAPLDVELAEAIASLPDDEWVLMLGREKYDPIPGSPGDVNHPGLAGKMIWWASARRSDPEPGVPLVILSAERHDSPGSALHNLTGQMRRRSAALTAEGEQK